MRELLPCSLLKTSRTGQETEAFSGKPRGHLYRRTVYEAEPADGATRPAPAERGSPEVTLSTGGAHL